MSTCWRRNAQKGLALPVFEFPDIRPPTAVPVTLEQERVEWVVTRCQDIERHPEPVGEDTDIVDNSRTDAEIMWARTFYRSVERQVKVDFEASRTDGTARKVGVVTPGISAELSAHVEQVVKAGLSSSDLRRDSDEHKVEVKVPARTKLTILIAWKRIWQCRQITLTSSQGETVVVPYEESVGLHFDMSLIPSP